MLHQPLELVLAECLALGAPGETLVGLDEILGMNSRVLCLKHALTPNLAQFSLLSVDRDSLRWGLPRHQVFNDCLEVRAAVGTTLAVQVLVKSLLLGDAAHAGPSGVGWCAVKLLALLLMMLHYK